MVYLYVCIVSQIKTSVVCVPLQMSSQKPTTVSSLIVTFYHRLIIVDSVPVIGNKITHLYTLHIVLKVKMYPCELYSVYRCVQCNVQWSLAIAQ